MISCRFGGVPCEVMLLQVRWWRRVSTFRLRVLEQVVLALHKIRQPPSLQHQHRRRSPDPLRGCLSLVFINENLHGDYGSQREGGGGQSRQNRMRSLPVWIINQAIDPRKASSETRWPERRQHTARTRQYSPNTVEYSTAARQRRKRITTPTELHEPSGPADD